MKTRNKSVEFIHSYSCKTTGNSSTHQCLSYHIFEVLLCLQLEELHIADM